MAEPSATTGPLLRCEVCGEWSGTLTPDEVTSHLIGGWPMHCGHTMRLWTARQIAAGEMPEQVSGCG